MIVFEQMLVILLLIVTGYVVKKLHMVSSESKKTMSTLVVNVFNPALIISSVLGDPEGRDTGLVLAVFAVAAGMFAALIITGKILSRIGKRDRLEQKVTELMYVFSNLGFIGIPVVKALLGDAYVIYVAVFILIFTVLFYTYGFSLLDTKKEVHVSFRITMRRVFLNIGTIAALIALVIFFAGIQLPYVLTTTINFLSNVTTPLSLLVIGVTIGEQESLVKIFADKQVYFFALMKMLVIPLFISIFLKMLPIPKEIQVLTLIMTAMPVGSMPQMLLNDRGINFEFCSDSIIVTTLASVITIPILIILYG